jgi:hypothetical protein
MGSGWRVVMTCALALASCKGEPLCAAPSDVLVAAVAGSEALTCGEADRARVLIETLGARSLAAHERERVVVAVRDAWSADPSSAAAAVAAARALQDRLSTARDMEAAELRSTASWEAVNGQGPLASFPGTASFVKSAVSVWASDDDERLVLAEADVEGWLHYASLCREAQGASPMMLSVSDRPAVYRMFTERFAAAKRDEQIAMTVFGAFWYDFRTDWKAAPAEAQHAWIGSAPLPPPMTATSLGYAEAIASSDLRRHADTWLLMWGPYRLEAR